MGYVFVESGCGSYFNSHDESVLVDAIKELVESPNEIKSIYFDGYDEDFLVKNIYGLLDSDTLRESTGRILNMPLVSVRKLKMQCDCPTLDMRLGVYLKDSNKRAIITQREGDVLICEYEAGGTESTAVEPLEFGSWTSDEDVEKLRNDLASIKNYEDKLAALYGILMPDDQRFKCGLISVVCAEILVRLGYTIVVTNSGVYILHPELISKATLH